jgi:hypothetical protein
MKNLTVEVTKEDIGTPGVWKPSGRCMIDRALDRKFGHNKYYTILRFVWEGITPRFKLPIETSRKLGEWSAGRPVEPFTFVLEEYKRD